MQKTTVEHGQFSQPEKCPLSLPEPVQQRTILLLSMPRVALRVSTTN